MEFSQWSGRCVPDWIQFRFKKPRVLEWVCNGAPVTPLMWSSGLTEHLDPVAEVTASYHRWTIAGDTSVLVTLLSMVHLLLTG